MCYCFKHREACRIAVVYFVCFIILCISGGCYSKATADLHEWKPVNHKLNKPHLNDESIQIVHFTSNYLPDTAFKDAKKSTEPATVTADNLIPDFYKVVLIVKAKQGLPYAAVIQIMCEAMSKALDMPLDDIRVSRYEVLADVMRLYFVYTVLDAANNVVLLPASDILPKLSIEKLQKETTKVRILNIKDGDHFRSIEISRGNISIGNIFSDQNWRAWQLAIIISCCLCAFFCIFVVMLFLCTRVNTKDAVNAMEERQVVVQPVLKPNLTGVNVIQPENKDCYVTETDSDTPSPCRSPLRRKGKGLLERRGSNASLTLDLNRSQENVYYGTPPKECSTEEYLLSASNRLSRMQLKNCLRDVKALHTEFWEIPMNHPEKVEVAGSGTKNRYKTILPNKATRVQLRNVDDDPLTSYINANYIRGYANERHAYIATQGPMTHTIDDFWSMVWEQKCPIIVMITKLKEKLKIKCELYIPDYQSSYMGIKVTVKKVTHQDGYIIRELHLTNGRESRCVYHFWYTAWPDHKTPDTAKQLLTMALEVERLRHNGNGTTKGPTVVHCSAGIGRTGCFIAVSIGIQQLLEENMVDILGTVCGLRLDRGGMVQTAEQYEFVYQALGVFEASFMPDRSGD